MIALHRVHVAAVIVGGFVVGKTCQYAAVAWLEPRLGFEFASLVGVVPFVAGMVWLKVRHPRLPAYRA